MTEKKLIPFDLQAALSGAKLVTRDGRVAKDFEIFRGCAETDPYKYLAVVEGNLFSFTDTGKFITDETHEGLDLFLTDEPAAPKTRTMWVNYYKSTGKPPFEYERIWFSSAFDDKTEAEEFANSEDHPFYIATVPIEIPQP